MYRMGRIGDTARLLNEEVAPARLLRYASMRIDPHGHTGVEQTRIGCNQENFVFFRVAGAQDL
jgi:hypothetical protein